MSMDKRKRNELILKYTPLVKNVVTRMTAKLPIDVADKEALINVGILGLMEALEKFDEKRNVQFETFAKFRIRGAVLDELRAHDWVPRSVRDKDDLLEKAFFALRKKLNRQPLEEEVAQHLGIPLEAYHRLLDEAKGISLISTEDLPPDFLEHHAPEEVLRTIEYANPLDYLSRGETREKLKQAINDLPEKERLVVALYYYEEMTMKEIGAVLEVTESRVCQLHSQALLRLKAGTRELR